MLVLILHRDIVRRGIVWWEDGFELEVHPNDLVLETVLFLDRLSASFPLLNGREHYKTILIIWRPGVGKVYLEPTKTWAEQGVSHWSHVYRYRPTKHRHASAA